MSQQDNICGDCNDGYAGHPVYLETDITKIQILINLSGQPLKKTDFVIILRGVVSSCQPLFIY